MVRSGDDVPNEEPDGDVGPDEDGEPDDEVDQGL
ncbi:hypothetical protein FB473_003240 [Brooklawnia cerclae]|uniref:Uncharacterized protein n=1 Tax=Brooklawnia cerclae TaxID=349934 RepID=A0ABX0SJJ0_9ACTN|nr:hypothetical protein [Brooklawnia cerclae]